MCPGKVMREDMKREGRLRHGASCAILMKALALSSKFVADYFGLFLRIHAIPVAAPAVMMASVPGPEDAVTGGKGVFCTVE